MLKAIALQNEMGPVFDISLDCEDGAQVGQEVAQAQLISGLIGSDLNRHQRIGARIHPADHAVFESDVRLILAQAAQQIAYLVVPKVRDVETLVQAHDFIQTHAQQLGRETIPIHVLIETHEAVAKVQEIAALPFVECLSFGIMDFVSDHHGAIPASAMRSPGQFTHPLLRRAKADIAAACHRYGKVASHNVCTEFKQIELVREDAQSAAQEFAYTRMWSIHPNQIPVIVQAFMPPAMEIEEAIAILDAAQKNNWGPIEHQGRLHDRASYRYYWSILKKAEKNAYFIPEGARHLLC